MRAFPRKPSGCLFAGPWARNRNIPISLPMRRPVSDCQPWFGWVDSAGQLSNALKRQRLNWEWINTRYENFPVGITISWLACSVITFSGTSRSDWGKKAPVITPSQLRLLLKNVLPLREFDIEMAIELVGWIQRRNHRSYLSHRKKKMTGRDLAYVSL